MKDSFCVHTTLSFGLINGLFKHCFILSIWHLLFLICKRIFKESRLSAVSPEWPLTMFSQNKFSQRNCCKMQLVQSCAVKVSFIYQQTSVVRWDMHTLSPVSVIWALRMQQEFSKAMMKWFLCFIQTRLSMEQSYAAPFPMFPHQWHRTARRTPDTNHKTHKRPIRVTSKKHAMKN